MSDTDTVQVCWGSSASVCVQINMHVLMRDEEVNLHAAAAIYSMRVAPLVFYRILWVFHFCVAATFRFVQI